MLISIVIPAHNRPAFLLEAVYSVAQQTYPNFEVIVIDDGSAPPISSSALEDILGHKVTVHRHESAQGIPKAKNAGIKAARGEIILLLDDDDLLTPDALEVVFHAFNNNPEIDCLFLGVHPFGPYADGAAKSRDKALTKIIEKLKPRERDGLYFFTDSLFDMLLDTVPIDFQRPAARRGAWNIIGGFDENSLFSESAWSIRASSICTLALTKRALNEWRIHGNNFGWPSGLEHEQIIRRRMDNVIGAGEYLLNTFSEQERAIHIRTKKMKRGHSAYCFSKAYYLRDKNKSEGLKALVRSFFLSPRPKHFRLAFTYLIPSRWLTWLSRL